MSEIKIEKNVPIPSWNLKAKGELYPFAKMNIGDSFAVDPKHRSTVRTQMWFQHRKDSRKKFASRLRDGELRIWRIK